jgi:hypothetical protein
MSEGSDRWEKYERAMAAYSNYYGRAVLVLLLYWILYLPGLIANVWWLREAAKTRRRIGYTPGGMGCLWWLLLVGLMPLALYCWLAGLLPTAISVSIPPETQPVAAE